MSATYHAPQLVAYDSHVLPSYPSAVAQARGPKAVMADSARAPQYSRYSQPTTSYSQPSSRHQYSTTSRHSTRPSTPTSGAIGKSDGTASRKGSSALVLHSLSIPSCINPKGGNLADFAAQITCLFWFESIETLRAAENIRSRPPTATLPRLTECAIPFSQFKKWAYSVLSTTQVTQNVILLALLFVYRLKTTNPSVKGRSGSEYRLLTVALMLGNKFLDDNTYTNKTWAEVSGITVQEIHVMEVEFLSNMRYSLLATKQEWEEWLVKLSCFSEYYERAQKQPTSPLNKSFTSPAPSPTATIQSAVSFPPLTPSATNVFSPTATVQNTTQAWPSTYHNPSVSPLSGKHVPGMNCRKRSSEDDATEPPAKRLSRQPNTMPPVARPQVVGEQPMRLPVPNLSLNTNPASAQGQMYPGTTSYAAQQHVSLPPLTNGVRAMATVYTPATTVPMPQLPMPTTTSMPQASLTPSNVSMHGVMGYGTPTKRHSPGSLSVYASSPLGEQFPTSVMHTPMVHTPISHSPSVYLQQRPSPYKPIRHVNTLLYPPPSASLNEYHLPTTQMHYQPLGRRNDLRTGVVPEFMHAPYRLSAQMPQMPHGLPHGSYPN
ncbi:meiotically up-regulated gene 80 protein [Colletotrichum spaethianum]|uniref:Meiotically up-regulated gene 80 protein n=1 Tax=Colletotrichum spaethianum TaxID=700344 RepID=A0AA37PCP6_9PEZI|nr:meiotically up-regulated gene 80 protein [Colletotrichum spaethianum]GKT49774.1 meiotically up-regulated gene 80 protein [Colletotrichum spaethianum]